MVDATRSGGQLAYTLGGPFERFKAWWKNLKVTTVLGCERKIFSRTAAVDGSTLLQHDCLSLRPSHNHSTTRFNH